MVFSAFFKTAELRNAIIGSTCMSTWNLKSDDFCYYQIQSQTFGILSLYCNSNHCARKTINLAINVHVEKRNYVVKFQSIHKFLLTSITVRFFSLLYIYIYIYYIYIYIYIQTIWP